MFSNTIFDKNLEIKKLTHSGSVSHKQVVEKTKREYEKFRIKQD